MDWLIAEYIYDLMDEDIKALKTYLTAVHYAEDEFEPLFALGKMYYKLGRYVDAKKAFKRALEADPTVEDVWNYLKKLKTIDKH